MLRQRLQGILSFLGLLAASAALGYGAWVLLTRPPERPGQHPTARRVAGPDSLEFFAVAGESVELTVVAPDGHRTSSLDDIGAAGRIPRSESKMDCPNFSSPDARDRTCTASVQVRFPAPGDYRIIASAGEHRAETLNVGWGTAGAGKSGAFDVAVQVNAQRPAEFVIIVGRESVSQRTVPRPLAR